MIVVQFNPKVWENPHPNSCSSNIIHLYHLQTKPVSLYSFSKVRNENRPVQPKKDINGEVQITYVQKDSFSRWWFQPPILRQQQRRIQPNDLFIFTTPPKTNMEPENTSLEKEKPLHTANFWGFHVCYRCKRFSFVLPASWDQGYICGPKFAKTLDESTRFRSLASSIRKDVRAESHLNLPLFTKTTYPFRARCLSFRFIFTFILAGCTWKHPFCSCQPSPADHPMCSSESWIFKVTENV